MPHHHDDALDDAAVLDAAVFLHEASARGWTQFGPELSARPGAAFLLREGVVRPTPCQGHELTLAGCALAALVGEVVRRAPGQTRTNQGMRAEAGRALRALVAEHARSV